MLARRMRSLKESGILTFSKKARELQAKGADIVRLDMGDLSMKTPDAIKRFAIEGLEEDRTHYEGVSRGLIELREAICEHYWKTYGVRFDPEEVAVTPGGMAATYTTFSLLCEEGDEVIFTDPAWEVYESQISTTLAQPTRVPLEEEGGWRLKTGSLESGIDSRTKLLVLNSPNNPTGSIFSEAEFDEIVSAAERADFKILWDEAYKDVVFDGTHHTLSEYDELQERVITVGSLSKSHAMTGWRVGYLISRDAEFMKRVESVARINWTCLPPFIQKAATQIFLDPSVSGAREALLDEYRKRCKIATESLSDAGIPCIEPKGGIYAFPNIRQVAKDSFEAADELLSKEGVAVVPGGYFGERGLYNMRICFTAPSDAGLREGLSRFAKGISRMSTVRPTAKMTN